MVDIISIVNPGYQKAVQAAEKENTKPAETLDTEEKTEESEAAGSGKPNGDVYEPEKKDPAAEEEAGTSYKPNKKLVEELKAEQAQMQSRFVNMVRPRRRPRRPSARTAIGASAKPLSGL